MGNKDIKILEILRGYLDLDFLLLITHYPLPITHYLLPITYYPLPIKYQSPDKPQSPSFPPLFP